MNKNILFTLLSVAVIAFGIYLFSTPQGKVKIAPIADAGSSMANYMSHTPPKALPSLSFVDALGVKQDNTIFKGKVTLLNLWATWCAPCRKEMPDLAALQTDLGGPDFQVIALSQDLKGYDASAAFLKEVGADNLALYVDDKATALNALQAAGLPVSLLINREGQEIGRVIGPAPWAGSEAKAIIRAAIAQR